MDNRFMLAFSFVESNTLEPPNMKTEFFAEYYQVLPQSVQSTSKSL